MKRRGNREGSIYKRKDGRWCGAVLLGYDFEGKPVRKYVYGKTRQQVADKLNKLIQDLNNGLLNPVKQDYSFGQWLKTYLELYRKPKLRQTTYDRYCTVLNNHLPQRLSEMSLKKVRAEHIQALYNSMAEAGLTRTTCMLHTIVSNALKQAVKLGYINRNVAEATTPPKRRQKEMRILGEEELNRFLEKAREHRLYPAFFLLVSMGLRRGELLGLQWDDIDWKRGTITIRRNLIYLRGKVAIQEPKTRGSYRTLPIPQKALSVLKEWREKWIQERFALGPDWPKTDFVFPSKIHTPLNPRNFLRTFKSILEQAGLPSDVTLHSLRHTYASILLKEGEHPKVVQELLGHTSVTTTLDIYSKVMPGLKRKAQETIDRVLKSGNVKEE